MENQSLIYSHGVLFFNRCGWDFVGICAFWKLGIMLMSKNVFFFGFKIFPNSSNFQCLLYGKCGMLDTSIYLKAPSLQCFMWDCGLLAPSSDTLKINLFLGIVF